VLSVAWHPDGSRLASCGVDNAVRIWDSSTLRELKTLRDHGAGLFRGMPTPLSSVGGVAWSPDGRMLASAGSDGAVRTYDMPTGKERLVRRFFDDGARAVCWSADGQYLAVAGDDALIVLNAESGKELAKLRSKMPFVKTIAWSPDRRRIAVNHLDGAIAVWDVHERRIETVLEGHPGPVSRDLGTRVITEPGSVEALAWSPDGTKLASGGTDTVIRIWHTASWKVDALLRGHLPQVECEFDGVRRMAVGTVHTLAWSSDGKQLASGGADGRVIVWAVGVGKEHVVLSGHARARGRLPADRPTGAVLAVAWSKSGREIASGGQDATVRVWQVSPAK
jgi:WD40 repeat protein